MAFRIEDEPPIDGMFISLDQPIHSLRTGRDPDGPILVILGSRFPTGHDGNVAGLFFELERWTRENFKVGDVAWRWCNEDYDTKDRVPFVGAPSPKDAPGFYISTGFNGWGITNGTAAGILIADQILARPKAINLGCWFSVNPDAHSTAEIDLTKWGVAMARKGGVSPDRVLNALDLCRVFEDISLVDAFAQPKTARPP